MKIGEIPDQEKVWDEIAESWNERRFEAGPRILEFAKEAKGNFLDLGCGSGRNLAENKNAVFYLVDFSKKMLNLAEKKAKKLKLKYQIIKSEVYELNFPDEFFDSAIYIATLHCLCREHSIKSLKELFRVLKKNGKAVITIWNKNHIAFKRFKNKKEILLAWRTGKDNEKRNLRYYYFFSEEEFIEELKKTGFKILDITDSKEDTGIIAFVEKE